MALATKYSEIQPGHSLRSRARHLALDALSLTNSTKANLARTPRVQFVYIHHVFDDEVESFHQQLAHLAADYTFIPYSEAIDRVQQYRIDKPYMAFSSDDGFYNNLNAAKALESFGTRACFFINTKTIGMNDEIAIRDFCSSRLDLAPVPFLAWSDVEALLASGHEIGSHTSGHFDVGSMELDDFRRDLDMTKSQIEAKTGPIHHFAFPYGRWQNFSEAALDATFEAGFKSCASAERGCHVASGPEHRMIFRDHLLAHWPTRHLDYFFLKNIRKAHSTQLQPY